MDLSKLSRRELEAQYERLGREHALLERNLLEAMASYMVAALDIAGLKAAARGKTHRSLAAAFNVRRQS